MVLPAQSRQFPRYLLQPPPAFIGICYLFQLLDRVRQFRCHHGSQPIAYFVTVAHIVQSFLPFQQPLEPFARCFPALPLLITAQPPFRDISLIDWPAPKLFSQPPLTPRQPVQPGRNFRTRFAILQTVVQLLPDLLRQPCNFSCATHICPLPSERRPPARRVGCNWRKTSISYPRP